MIFLSSKTISVQILSHNPIMEQGENASFLAKIFHGFYQQPHTHIYVNINHTFNLLTFPAIFTSDRAIEALLFPIGGIMKDSYS